MPEAPAAIAVLSMTRMSLPPPLPWASSLAARCQAVERPWIPAPMIEVLHRMRQRHVISPTGPGVPHRSPRSPRALRGSGRIFSLTLIGLDQHILAQFQTKIIAEDH